MDRPTTRVVTASLPLPLAEKLDELAKHQDRTRSWIVKQALASWIEKEERRHQRTLQALAQVDTGVGIPHEEVVAYMRSKGSDNPLPRPVPRKC